MKEKIVEALSAEAEKRGCKILFAVESGSRAWGFASPDSDYDVRAVYIKPLDFYLGLDENPADTWNVMLPDELDVAAWDLRKTLRQMMKSNANLLEWLESPIVYSGENVISELRTLAEMAFDPKRVAFHYAAMMRHAMEDRGEDGIMSVKKLCYALRSSLCVQWVFERSTMPPTKFIEVVAGLDLPWTVRDAIAGLLALKATANERDRIVPDAAFQTLLADRLLEVERHSWSKSMPPTDALKSDLEKFFRDTIRYEG